MRNMCKVGQGSLIPGPTEKYRKYSSFLKPHNCQDS